ncbi:MAG: hypothetical protein ABSH52_08330 [Terriglobia bacterium]|jgi:hypothetical protein
MPESQEWIPKRQVELGNIIQKLLEAHKRPFKELVKKGLPTTPGLYAISRTNAASGEYIYAGKAGESGL